MTNVLVVDDDRVTRHLLQSVLEGAGYSVTTAGDGIAALEHARRTGADRPDLILLDVWMPGMSGLDVLARLHDEGLQPRVVVMTSDDTPETLLSALKGQALQFMSKPIAPDALIETVAQPLSKDAPVGIDVVSSRPDWV